MPASSHFRTDQKLSIDTEVIHMNINEQRTNEISRLPTSRPRVEILRSNSPTLKRLISVRVKLQKYIDSRPDIISISQVSLSEPYKNEKPSNLNASLPVTTSSPPPPPAPPPAPPPKRIKSKPNRNSEPNDKITYEKTASHSGKVRKKCSLEIWLPKPSSDDDDGANLTSRPTSSNPDKILNKSAVSPQAIVIKSRQSSIMKLHRAATAYNEIKPFSELSQTRPEQKASPDLSFYDEYLLDQTDDRPRSGKTVDTNKSDGSTTSKNVKRQPTRSYTRHLSPSTMNTEDTAESTPTGLPMSSKNLLANIRQTSTVYETKNKLGSNNSTMLNELMRKYSMIKKGHQELTQAKLQIERPYHDSKYNAHLTKDHSSLPSPPLSDTTSFVSADNPTMTVRKLYGDYSPPETASDRVGTSSKSIDRRSLQQNKSSNRDLYPSTRLLNMVNNRQISTAVSNEILPTVIGKRSEESYRYSFQRSKTLDVTDPDSIESLNKIPSRLPARSDSPKPVPKTSHISHRPTKRTERISPRFPKRSLVPPTNILRPEQPVIQLVQYQKIQKSAQRYHQLNHSSSSSTTDLSTNNNNNNNNKVLVHLKYSTNGNIDCNCVMPE